MSKIIRAIPAFGLVACLVAGAITLLLPTSVQAGHDGPPQVFSGGPCAPAPCPAVIEPSPGVVCLRIDCLLGDCLYLCFVSD